MTNVLLAARQTPERPLVRVQSFVQLQMHQLGEFRLAQVAGERFLPRVQASMRFQVRR